MEKHDVFQKMEHLEKLDQFAIKIQEEYDQGMTKLGFFNLNHRGQPLHPNSYMLTKAFKVVNARSPFQLQTNTHKDFLISDQEPELEDIE